MPDDGVRLIGLEAGGDGVDTGRHAATITGGTPGVLHGARSYLLQDDNGQTIESHSISAGLDYPGRRPRALLPARHRPGRVPRRHRRRGDGGVRAAVPHRGHHPGDRVGARAGRRAELGQELGPDALLLVNLSGRGDKDVETASRWFGLGDRDDVDPGPAWTPTSSPPRARSATTRPSPARTRGSGMSRSWPSASAQAKAEGRAALIAYLPVGYPDVDASIAAMVAAVEGGADVVEIGVPYSDPGMDGPVIQEAVDVAVRAGVGHARRAPGRRGGRRGRRGRRW